MKASPLRQAPGGLGHEGASRELRHSIAGLVYELLRHATLGNRGSLA